MINTLIFIFLAVSCGIAILTFKHIYENRIYFKNYKYYLLGLVAIVVMNFILLFIDK